MFIQETDQAKDPTKSLRSSFWLMDAMMESAYALSLSDLAPPAAAPPPTPPPPPLAPETPLVDSIFAKKKLYFSPQKTKKQFLSYGSSKKKSFLSLPLRNLNLTQTFPSFLQHKKKIIVMIIQMSIFFYTCFFFVWTTEKKH